MLYECLFAILDFSLYVTIIAYNYLSVIPFTHITAATNRRHGNTHNYQLETLKNKNLFTMSALIRKMANDSNVFHYESDKKGTSKHL